MNKKYIIKKNYDIQEVITKNEQKVVNNYFVIYKKANNIKNNRYCISVSKKIGKAFNRNYYKRIIKDILNKNKFNNSYDYVIILRTRIINKKYLDIQNSLLNIFKGEK